MIQIFKTLLIGRPNGFRRRIVNTIFSETEDTSPSSSFASPMGGQEDMESSASAPKEAPKGVTPPEGFEVVLHVDALNDGDITEVIIAGTAIAVAKQNGVVYAFDNTCPHAGGPLSEGSLENQGDAVMVRCPYHGWDFDISDGHCVTSPDTKLGCFETQIVDDAICVRV